MTGYPWQTGDVLLAADLNAAIANAGAVNAVFDVLAYGAKCDGVTDDTAAINAVFAAVRATSYNWGIAGIGPLMHGVVQFPGSRSCLITGTINATGLQGYALVIDGGGCTLDCHVTGAACIDMLGSLFFHVKDLTIVGNSTTIPTIGIQIGRINTTALSPINNITFDNVTIDGTFSLASFYNFAAETCLFSSCLFWNHSANVNSYCVIQDGYNHFHVPSAFVTQAAPVDTAQSFNQNTFLTVDIRALGSGHAAWIGCAARHSFITGYMMSNSTTGAVVLYNIAQYSNVFLDLDVHFEGSLTDAVMVSGPLAAPVILGFRFIDHHNYASNAILRADTGITSVAMTDCLIRIGSYADGTHGQLVDTTAHAASIWTFAGTYASTFATGFNAVGWQGPVIEGAAYTFTPSNTLVRQTVSGSSQTVLVPASVTSVYLNSTASAAMTGMILAGGWIGQQCAVINQSGFTLTWLNTSVVGGPTIAANAGQFYVFGSNSQWWPV